MKLLILPLIGMMLIGCGNAEFGYDKPASSPDVDPVINPGPDYGQIEEVLLLTASKKYHPSSNEDDVVDLTEIKELSLPAEIEVVSGNAGNYYSLLTIDDIICYYKGGSGFSYPLQMGNVSEIEKGQKYHLSFCRDATNGAVLDLQAGDSVFAQDEISLTIHNGDSTEETIVQLKIEVL